MMSASAPLNLLSLRYVVEAARAGSISKASQNLLVSQPHLSNVIRSVERDFDLVIFRRSSKGIQLTDNGKTFIKYASNLLQQADDFEFRYKQKDKNSLHFNISVTRSHQVIRIITNFINRNADKERMLIRVKETNPFTVIEDVYTGEAEMGILHYYNSQQESIFSLYKMYGIQYEPFYNRQFLLCLSQDNPVANRLTITKEDLAGQALVLYGDYESSAASYDVVTQMSDLFFSHKRIYVYDRAGAMEILSRCPDTYTWISGLNNHTLIQYGLVLRNFGAATTRNVGDFIFMSKQTLSDASRELYEELRNINWEEKLTK